MVIGGQGGEGRESLWDAERILAGVVSLASDGVPRPAAIRAVAKLAGWRKRDVYSLVNESDEGVGES
jgi:hypothetical protein